VHNRRFLWETLCFVAALCPEALAAKKKAPDSCMNQGPMW
jgi:hypothetical protein